MQSLQDTANTNSLKNNLDDPQEGRSFQILGGFGF